MAKIIEKRVKFTHRKIKKGHGSMVYKDCWGKIDRKWHHFAMQQTKQGILLYVNGKETRS